MKALRRLQRSTKPLRRVPSQQELARTATTLLQDRVTTRAAQESTQRLYGGSRHYHLKQSVRDRRRRVRRAGASSRVACAAICGRPDPEHVDHSHETGAVRGILCFNCNGGLGQFRDSIDALLRGRCVPRTPATPTRARARRSDRATGRVSSSRCPASGVRVDRSPWGAWRTGS